MSRNFKEVLSIRNKVVSKGILTGVLSDGALEFMVEDFGYTHTKNYLKKLLNDN